MKRLFVPLLLSALCALPALAESPADILKNSPASDWRKLVPRDTLVMDLDGHQVIIELAPRFAPKHVANIRVLAHEGYYDGLAVVRVQDDFVTQWGDPYEDDPARRKSLGSAAGHLPAEFTTSFRHLPFSRLSDRDGWAPIAGWSDGFPVGADPKREEAWIAHCYGVVGAGRNMAVDSSTGAELYAIIGQSPRMLDRNITVVGRVLKGMEYLSALPRGEGAMGMYDKPEQFVPIRSVKLMSDLPAERRPAFEVLKTGSKTWKAYLETRRNPPDDFHVYKANFTNVCNVPVPIR